MESKTSIFIRCFLAVVLAAAALPNEAANGAGHQCALLLQQNPPDAGIVTPAPGIHRFAMNSTITLTAVANPGYQFLYWLGDVAEPTSNRTTVRLDVPKIVIAVFERTEFEIAITPGQFVVQGAPIGGAFGPAGIYARRGFSAARGVRRPPRRPPFQPPEVPDFPVPGEEDEFPVPVPEPTTMTLLAIGTLLISSRRRNKICGLSTQRASANENMKETELSR